VFFENPVTLLRTNQPDTHDKNVTLRHFVSGTFEPGARRMTFRGAGEGILQRRLPGSVNPELLELVAQRAEGDTELCGATGYASVVKSSRSVSQA
jgi:hypothetical protein